MYYIEYDNKIVLADNDKARIQNTLQFMPQYADTTIKETDQRIENFMFVDSSEWLIWKSAQIRNLRNTILSTVIDPVVSNPLRWAEMTESEREKYTEYRKYLLNIPSSPDFPRQAIKSFDEFNY